MMMQRDAMVGDAVPPTPRRGILGDVIGEPVWYPLTTPPQKEFKAERFLGRHGAMDAWHPTERRWRPVAGPRRKISYEAACAPGYVFFLTDREVHWDVLFDNDPNCISKVICHNGLPCAISEAAMGEMRLVPARIADKREADAAALLAARAALMPVPGLQGRLLTGPLAGYVVDVTNIHAGLAWFIMGGVKGSYRVEDVERVA